MTAPLFAREAQCHGKHRYPGERSARMTAKKRRVGGEQLHAYVCRHCGWWHIGHTTPRALRRSSTQLVAPDI